MRIRRLTVQNFRGISQPTTLNFFNSDPKQSSSCLLIGENGSGKSSFVDALEFCLSGKFPANPNTTRATYLQRLANAAGGSQEPRVEVEFTDGSIYSRSITQEGSAWQMNPTTPHSSFHGAGFTLRREEIINFLRTPPERRYGVFASFMRSTVANMDIPQENKDAVADAESARQIKGDSRDSEARKLARRMSVSFGRIEPALHSVAAFNGWFASNGYVKNQDERRGRLTRDRAATYRQATVVRAEIADFVIATDRMHRVRQIATKAPLISLLAEVGVDLTASFRQISSSSDAVDSVELALSPDKAEISLNVRLKNRTLLRAEDYFSEANLDLLALLLFLALMKFAADSGQPKIMALDDVLQSVDASIRIKVAQYLLAEFGDWQLFVTFHDRLWREQFGAVFSSRHKFVERELLDWGLESGPKLIEAKRDPSSALRDSLRSNDSRLICGNAGYLLEVMSDWLSKSLQTSVTRRHGDKYTLGDTWPGVLKRLRKTDLHKAGLHVDSYMWLRNMHGAHYNEWASGLSISDAENFAGAVLSLWGKIWCTFCKEPIGKHGDLLHCRCGARSLAPS
ncbi:AAA family ATPase [Streptomyces sp. NPDC057718]|uniref:AAA family ATPase n=1 Tax=Streptomyces sp. NPDC057718 TaxID=3346225 RepID=UPI00367EB5E8